MNKSTLLAKYTDKTRLQYAKLSKEAWEARKPLPYIELLRTVPDTPHPESVEGQALRTASRAAHVVRCGQ